MKNRISVKKVKINQEMSEETMAFSCMVLLDGQEICHAKNTGTGGSNSYYPVEGKKQADIQELEAIAQQITEMDFEPLDYLLYDLTLNFSVANLKQKKNIVMRKGDQFFTQALTMPVAKLVSTHEGLAFLQKEARHLIGEGYQILNMNFDHQNLLPC